MSIESLPEQPKPPAGSPAHHPTEKEKDKTPTDVEPGSDADVDNSGDASDVGKMSRTKNS